MIEFVKMNQDHVSQIAELEQICFSMPWSENAITSELTNPLSLWLVAIDNQKVVGYVGSQSVMGEADMMNIAVSEEYRRKGIGEALVSQLISALSERDVFSLSLEVRATNQSAISLYMKMGFEKVGCRPGYYKNPKEDAFIFRKEWRI